MEEEKRLGEILVSIKYGVATPKDRTELYELEARMRSKIGKTRTEALIKKIKKDLGILEEEKK